MSPKNTGEHGAWSEALSAIDAGEPSVEIERAILEAARRIKRRKKKTRQSAKQAARDVLRAATGRVSKNTLPRSLPPVAPGSAELGALLQSGAELPNHQHCYVCKGAYREVHAFYHLLCVTCGDANFARRAPQMELRGRRALVTGGRTKIGYRAALLLLRAGAHVTVTTRYPYDAYRRYSSESDWEDLRPRLRIDEVDFRDIRATQTFLDGELGRGDPLDILINQAAQTIRGSAILEQAERARDGEIKAELFALTHARRAPELAALGAAHPALGVAHPAGERAFDGARETCALSVDPDHGELCDNNARNSWNLTLEDVTLGEFLEVQSVNVFAPYTFTARLVPLMKRSRFPDRYVVQVSAIEGQFYGAPKNGKHPHTNRAKAALHMLVRTSSASLAQSGIYMNAVDPGWVSDQSAILTRSRHAPFCPPLDVVDGASRIVDPIARGLRGDLVFGQLLKDYAPASW